MNENVLVDLTLNGQARKALVHPDRNGYVYVVDRTTGEVLSAVPFVHITTSRGVDLKTGRLQYVQEKEPQTGKVIHDICPVAPGGKDWQPSAYSPRTRWLYIPHQNLCQDEEAVPANYIAGTPYVGANVKMYSPSQKGYGLIEVTEERRNGRSLCGGGIGCRVHTVMVCAFEWWRR